MNRGYATKIEVAKYLNLSVRTIERLMGPGLDDLRFSKINKTVRLKWTDVDEFMEKRSVRQIVDDTMQFMGQ